LDYQLNTPVDYEIFMLSISHYLGNFSLIHHLTNQNSILYRAISNRDVPAIKKFYDRNRLDFNRFNDEQTKEFNEVYNEIDNKYRSQLEKKNLPIPDQFLVELGEIAIKKGNFTTAHSSFKILNQLDKAVNENIVKGVEKFQSRELKTLEDNSGNAQDLEEYMAKVAKDFYVAMRVKNPFGNQYQYLAPELFGEKGELLKKYFKHIELALLKEIIEFAIEYLIQDKTITEKIITNLQSGKIRKLFLKHLAKHLSLGEDSYEKFVDRYKNAAEILKDAKSESDFLSVQRILLGRRTGDEEFYQFLRELAFEQPIATLVCAITVTDEGTPYYAPILMKSGQTLLEFLELDS